MVARGEILGHTLLTLREDDSINVWMLFGRPIIDRYYPMLIEFVNATGKAMVVCCGVPLAPDVQAALSEHGIAVLLDPELCLRALARIACRPAEEPVPAPPLPERTADARVLRGRQAGELLARHGLEVSASAAPWLRVEIARDRDFGPVIMANWLPAYRVGTHRVVRALPATGADLLALVDDLGEQLQEWPAEPVDIEEALATVVRAYEQSPACTGWASSSAAPTDGWWSARRPGARRRPVDHGRDLHRRRGGVAAGPVVLAGHHGAARGAGPPRAR